MKKENSVIKAFNRSSGSMLDESFDKDSDLGDGEDNENSNEEQD